MTKHIKDHIIKESEVNRVTGKEILELRTRAGLTQQALADGIGVRQETVWTWEAERKQPSQKHSKQAEQFLKSVIAQNERADSLTETLKAHQTENSQRATDTEYAKGYKDGVQAEIRAISDKFKLNI